MLDRSGRQDARAPGGVIGIERAGEVDTAFGGRAFAGDYAIADNSQSVGGVLRQDGSSAPFAAGLVLGADITGLPNSLFLASISPRV
jgi:hypothetical protein